MTATLSLRDLRTRSGRTALDLRRAVGSELRRLRLDAGLSLRDVAAAARITPSHLSAIERGLSEASLATLVAIGHVLGANVSVRLFPGTGPRIRDRFQALIVEALMRTAHPAWKRMAEVPVRRPARGVIDVVFARPREVIVATEVQSEVRRLEQELRWGRDKAESLPSAASWTMLSGGAERIRVERLLVLRNTQANRAVAKAFAETLRGAYPAAARDAYRALGDPTAAFPGSAILWCDVSGGIARIRPAPPRGVSVGR